MSIRTNMSAVSLAAVLAVALVPAEAGAWSYKEAAEPYKDKLASGALTIVVADTLPMQIQQTKDGLGNGLVGQRPFEMGYKAMYMLKDLAEGKTLQDPTYTGLDVCSNDNIDTCVQ